MRRLTSSGEDTYLVRVRVRVRVKVRVRVRVSKYDHKYTP